MRDYNGKLFSILGDSISTLEGYSEPQGAEYYRSGSGTGIYSKRDTWWGQVIDTLGAELLVNNSISGSTVCYMYGYEIESWGCSKARTCSLSREDVSPDVIMVFLGTNDWGCGLRLKPSAEVTNPERNFNDAYRIMLGRLRQNYPEAEIWCFTLPLSDNNEGENGDFPYDYGGVHIEKYCDIIRKNARECGCKLIDLYEKCERFESLEGFHPTALGMTCVSRAVLLCLSEN